MSNSSSTLFDDAAAAEAALERVMAMLGGRLVEDTTTSAEPGSRDQQTETR